MFLCLVSAEMKWLLPPPAVVVVVVVVVVSLSFPPQPPVYGPTLALESVVTVSPLSVLWRGDSPAPPLPPPCPQRCHLAPDRAIHLLSVPTPRAPITMATAELIATLIQLKFSLLCQHPTPTMGRREGGQGSWAGVPSTALL